MRTAVIVHQQICQLRWHLLACLGLTMVLPIEEAVVSFRAGDGFYSVGLAVGAVMFSPLLAGLIACANVQGDLSEKRYIFWRSKPASVKKLVALKFFVGLILSLAVIACPIMFAVVSSALCGKDLDDPPLKYYVPIPVIIAVMTYSLCFGCNVLVRNTARSWLIGMLLAGFVLVFPFMLPLGFTDTVSDIEVWMLGFYPAVILVASAAAFVFALFAAQHDWHLMTNLKGLLCVGAALVFILLMLFSNQVANIRVLDEKEVDGSGWGHGTLDEAGDGLFLRGQSYVDVDKKGISLRKIQLPRSRSSLYPSFGNFGIDSEGREVTYGPTDKGYIDKSYPRHPNKVFHTDRHGDIYYFGIISCYRTEGEGRQAKDVYEKVYLRSYKLIGASWEAIDELDMSDFIGERVNSLRMAMRLTGNTLIACVNNSYVAVDVTNPQEMTQIDRKLDVLQSRVWLGYEDRREEFSIPLVPVEGISIEERIKLSIDLRYRFRDDDNDIWESSIVDVVDGKISFFSAYQRDVARFDVTRWDEENIYCKFSTARPFTILERMSLSSGPHDRKFVKNQKLYVQEDQQLMVFDVRSDRKIRKLGHFYRMDCYIEDVAVLDDGKLLLCAWWNKHGRRGRREETRYLYLLENPE